MPSVETPADEHQGHLRLDYRFNPVHTAWPCATTWCAGSKDNESGGLNLPGTGFIWDNNVDTVHGMFTSVLSPRLLNEVRAQYSRYTDRRAAKLDGVSIQRTNYAISGGNDQGTWGVIPEVTYDLSATPCRCGSASTR